MATPSGRSEVPTSAHPVLRGLAALGLKCDMDVYWRSDGDMIHITARNGGIRYRTSSRTGSVTDALARMARQAGLEHLIPDDELPWPRGQAARTPYGNEGKHT